MTTFPNSPRFLKGDIVLIDPETSAVQRIIALQVHSVGGEGGDWSDALRLKGVPVGKMNKEMRIDATITDREQEEGRDKLTCFSDISDSGKFCSLSPKAYSDQLTPIELQEVRPPEIGNIDPARYEGWAIMVQGHDGGGWNLLGRGEGRCFTDPHERGPWNIPKGE